MLKLKESPPCESLGPGSISKINDIDMGGAGGDQFTFPEKSRCSEQNSQDTLPGVVGSEIVLSTFVRMADCVPK